METDLRIRMLSQFCLVSPLMTLTANTITNRFSTVFGEITFRFIFPEILLRFRLVIDVTKELNAFLFRVQQSKK